MALLPGWIQSAQNVNRNDQDCRGFEHIEQYERIAG